jgi:hypothetical protein
MIGKKRVLDMGMVEFIEGIFSPRGLPKIELSQVPGVLAEHLDSLPERYGPEFIEAFILSEGLVTLFKVADPFERGKFCNFLEGWRESTFACLNHCAAMEVSSKFTAVTIYRFLYDGTKIEDRASIFGAIMASNVFPWNTLHDRARIRDTAFPDLLVSLVLSPGSIMIKFR